MRAGKVAGGRSAEPARPASPTAAPAAPARRAEGNQAALRRLSWRVAPAEGPAETGADLAAQSVLSGRIASAPPPPRAGADAPASVATVLAGAGRSLPAPERAFFEKGFARDLAAVRLHDDAPARHSAAEIRARAYAAGHHIVLGPTAPALGTMAGRALLAHELAHVMSPAEGVIARQGEEKPPPAPSAAAAPSPPAPPPAPPPDTLSLPGGLTLFPGPLQLANISGLKLPLPASLRATNALSAGGSGPAYVIDWHPGQVVFSLLDRITLSGGTAPGTPPGGPVAASNKADTTAKVTAVKLDTASGKLSAFGDLEVPTSYPLTLGPPTKLSWQVQSTDPGKFAGDISLGPARADFTLGFHYDADRIGKAVSPAFKPEGGLGGFADRVKAIVAQTAPGVSFDGVKEAFDSLVSQAQAGKIDGAGFATQMLALVASSIPKDVDLDKLKAAVSGLVTELTHPGFTASGTLHLGPVPLSSFHAEAPTTVPLSTPLLGAPAAFPLSMSTKGVILAPAGAVTNIPVPAFGYTSSDYGTSSGRNITAAALPTISPTGLSSGSFAKAFPVYLYAEVQYVRRVSAGFDIGIRAIAALQTDTLAKPTAGATDWDSVRNATMGSLGDAQDRTKPPPLPNIGAYVVGQF